MSTNSLIFPEGVTYKQRYVTGGDFAPTDITYTNMGNLYRYAPNTAIDLKIDTSTITDFSNAFAYCGIFSIPLFDTSNASNMNNMFQSCTQLLYAPLIDTSNTTYIRDMFNNCTNLVYVPQFDTSNVTDMYNMFNSCPYLTTIPLFDCGNVYDIGIFGYSGSTAIQHIGGFKDLGKQSSFNQSSLNNYFLSKCLNLTYESAMNVINNLYDRKTAGYSVLTLKFHANVLALLSAEDIAIATNKGWTIS